MRTFARYQVNTTRRAGMMSSWSRLTLWAVVLSELPAAAATPPPVERAIEQVKPAGGWAVCVGTTEKNDGEMFLSLRSSVR
jgi:hypothetical protein